jgi:peptidoglycan hydrolase-like protein with peptidoglycan-binding domain
MKTHLYKLSVIAIASLMLSIPLMASAQADTNASSQIQALMSQITSLQQQLQTLLRSTIASGTEPMWHASSTPPRTAPPMGPGMGDCPQFNRDLSVGAQGSDVSQLQQMLAGEGFLSASSTTGFFGTLTAHALSEFQTRSGITASSSATGFLGALTRTFLSSHCGEHPGMSTTSPVKSPMIWQAATSTQSWMNAEPSGEQNGQAWNASTSTGDHRFGPMGSTTPPRPCAQDDANGAAAALFVPHVVLPMMMMMHPCPPSGDGSQQ